MRDNRLGKFLIAATTVEDNPELVREIMGRCIVIRCEMLYYHNAFEYVALSPDFDEVPKYSAVPEYYIMFTVDGDNTTFKFERKSL